MATNERKAIIKNCDMSEDMQQDAVDCASQAMDKFNIEKDIAAFIKKEFDKKYTPTWYMSPPSLLCVLLLLSVGCLLSLRDAITDLFRFLTPLSCRMCDAGIALLAATSVRM